MRDIKGCASNVLQVENKTYEYNLNMRSSAQVKHRIHICADKTLSKESLQLLLQYANL